MSGERKNWVAWHSAYKQPTTDLSRRLISVKKSLLLELDRRRDGDVRVVSMCAGQGLDVIQVLAEYPRRDSVKALLVELDAQNVQAAEASAKASGLINVTARCADAALTDNYRDAVPADIVLACGVFGNIPPADVVRTISFLPRFCRVGSTVIWTRRRERGDEPTGHIRRFFREAGFDEVSFDAPADARYSVGVARFIGQPPKFIPGITLFRFHR